MVFSEEAGWEDGSLSRVEGVLDNSSGWLVPGEDGAGSIFMQKMISTTTITVIRQIERANFKLFLRFGRRRPACCCGKAKTPFYIIFIPEAVPLYLLYALSGKLEGTRR